MQFRDRLHRELYRLLNPEPVLLEKIEGFVQIFPVCLLIFPLIFSMFSFALRTCRGRDGDAWRGGRGIGQVAIRVPCDNTQAQCGQDGREIGAQRHARTLHDENRTFLPGEKKKKKEERPNAAKR